MEFNIHGSCLQTLAQLSPLPAITRPVTIDGYMQPGASANTLAMGNNAVLLIELSGTNSDANYLGLQLTASGCTVRGMMVNRFNYGIWLYLSNEQ